MRLARSTLKARAPRTSKLDQLLGKGDAAAKAPTVTSTQLEAAVVALMDGFIMPHADTLALVGFYDAVHSSAELRGALLEFHEQLGEIYEVLSETHTTFGGGRSYVGVSMYRFIGMAEQLKVKPKLSTAQIKAAFIHSLHLALYQQESTVLLAPMAFQEAVLRLALLVTHPPAEDGVVIARVPLELSDARLDAIRTCLTGMHRTLIANIKAQTDGALDA